ncbi:MAG: RNA methyltransferase [Bacteroidaceae bacterium]|nr:RNA methyltransferase [Bacteroidaceae bacterium]
MLSKADIKFIRSLEYRKYRQAAGAFVAEGPKTVGELSKHLHLRMLVDDAEEAERCSLQRSPQGILGVFDIPHHELPTEDEIRRNIILALDGVQDPGNVGTIIRLADWFGIEHVMLGTGSADAFAPKTVQATMGALARVKTHEVDLREWLRSLPADTNIYGTFLDGKDIYGRTLGNSGVIVMGNEGRGISDEIATLVTDRLFIPPYPLGRETSESLNVAIATAITCAEFRRTK